MLASPANQHSIRHIAVSQEDYRNILKPKPWSKPADAAKLIIGLQNLQTVYVVSVCLMVLHGTEESVEVFTEPTSNDRVELADWLIKERAKTGLDCTVPKLVLSLLCGMNSIFEGPPDEDDVNWMLYARGSWRPRDPLTFFYYVDAGIQEALRHALP